MVLCSETIPQLADLTMLAVLDAREHSELQINFLGPFSESYSLFYYESVGYDGNSRRFIICRTRKHAAQCHSQETLHKQLDQFLHERAFDLYFQSPWVSDSHILEIMETSFYNGLRFLNYLLYVTSLWHVYNALRSYTALSLYPSSKSCARPS